MKQLLLFACSLLSTNIFAQNSFSWSQVSNYPTTTSEMASCGYNGYVYSFNNCTNALFRYKPANNKWDTLASLSSPSLCNASMCATGNKLYIISSHNIGVYDLPTNTWTTRVVAKDETTPVISDDNDDFSFYPYSFDTVVSNGDTIIKKGINRYTISTNVVTSLAYMNTPRKNEQAVYFKGKIYSFGGKTLNGSVLNTGEVYDITSDSWTNISNTFKYRHSGAAVSDGKYIYLLGGESGSGYTKHKDVEVYDPANNTVTTLSVANSMLREASRFAFGLADDQLVIAGGLTNTPADNIATNFVEASDFTMIIAEARKAKEMLVFNIDDTQSNVFIYPNPSKGLVTIDITNPKQAKKICVYDIVGHCLQTNTINECSKIQLDLSYLPNGNYSISVENEMGAYSRVLQLVK